jgi:ribose transport system substrate-binding protein
MKKLNPLLVTVLFLLLLSTGILACFFLTGDFRKDRPIKIIAVIKNLTPKVEFWEVMCTGMRAAASEFGLDLAIYGPMAEGDIKVQIAILSDILDNSPPTILILAATDQHALVPLVEKADSMGIPVITVDSGVNSPIPVTLVATNNVDAGEKIAEEMVRLIDPRKKLAIISHVPGTATAIEREQGIRKVLEQKAGYGGLDERTDTGKDYPLAIIGTWFTGNSIDNAYIITMKLLDEYPNLGGILATTELNTIGTAKAIQERNLKDDIIIVGFDNSMQEIKFIEDGTIAATVIQKPFNMGYLAVRTAADILEKRLPPPFIDTGSVLITRKNLYEPENQKLLFPFVDLFQRSQDTQEKINHSE